MVVAELKPLAFEIAACTSFDEECPPQELLLEQHGPNARGWQSERFCTWPQVIVLKTRVGNSRIRKVQTLVHHFKIPTRLEFYVGKTAGERQMSSNGSNSGDTAGYRDAQPAVEFTRLGYVALNDNEQIGYKARELKEIHIDAEGEYLKIVAHKCYVNNLNLYNQVGIVAVTLFGEPANIDYMLKSLDSRQEALLGLDPAEEYSNIGIPHDNEHAALWGMINRSSTNRRISATKDLGFEGILDDKMRTLVNAISVAKEAAVREERFADAKALKMISDQCREASEELFKLQTAKARAIELEDYDIAGHLKDDIDAIREALLNDTKRAGFQLDHDGIIVKLPAVEEHSLSRRSSHSQLPNILNRTLPPSPPSSKHASPPKPSLHPHVQSQLPLYGATQYEEPPLDVQRDVVPAASHPPNFNIPDIPVRSTHFSQSTREQNIPPPAQVFTGDRLPQFGGAFTSSTGLPSNPLPPSVHLPEIPRPQEVAPKAPSTHSTSPNAELTTPSVNQSQSLPQPLAQPQVQPEPQNNPQPPPRPVSPPVPALLNNAQKNNAMWEEYPDDSFQAPPPKRLSKPVKNAARKKSPVRTDPQTVTTSIESSKKEQITSPFPPKGLQSTTIDGHKLPPGYDHPEPISDQLAPDFALSIEVFGQLLMQCALGKQFPLREWAFGEIAGVIRKCQTAKSARYKTETGSEVDYNAVAEAGYQVVLYGVEDSREKSITGAIALWEQVNIMCDAKGVPPAVSFRYFDKLVSILLTKAADMNPRVKQACINMTVQLVKSFPDAPYSMWTYVLKPIPKKGTVATSWKLIKGRLDVLLQAVQECGINEEEETGKHRRGVATLPGVMEWVKPNLQHSNVEVREAAIKIVVELRQSFGEDALAPFLKDLRPQLLETIRLRQAEANGTPTKRAVKARPEQPWKQSPKRLSRTNRSTENLAAVAAKGDAEVHHLQEMLQTLQQKIADEYPSAKYPVGDSVSHGAGKKTGMNVAAAAESPNSSLSSNKGGLVGKPTKRGNRLSNAQNGAVNNMPNGNNMDPQQLPKSTKPIREPAVAPRRAPNADVYSNHWNIDHTCIFCDEMNEGFTEENLDMHYWRDCPVLVNCPQCKLVVEIPILTDHLLTECDKRAEMKQCSRCKEAFLSAELPIHMKEKKCKPASTVANVARCPLCHANIPAGEDGWRSHLIENGCPESSRKPRASQFYAQGPRLEDDDADSSYNRGQSEPSHSQPNAPPPRKSPVRNSINNSKPTVSSPLASPGIPRRIPTKTVTTSHQSPLKSTLPTPKRLDQKTFASSPSPKAVNHNRESQLPEPSPSKELNWIRRSLLPRASSESPKEPPTSRSQNSPNGPLRRSVNR